MLGGPCRLSPTRLSQYRQTLLHSSSINSNFSCCVAFRQRNLVITGSNWNPKSRSLKKKIIKKAGNGKEERHGVSVWGVMTWKHLRIAPEPEALCRAAVTLGWHAPTALMAAAKYQKNELKFPFLLHLLVLQWFGWQFQEDSQELVTKTFQKIPKS